jgi:hypothetical protein
MKKRTILSFLAFFAFAGGVLFFVTQGKFFRFAKNVNFAAPAFVAQQEVTLARLQSDCSLSGTAPGRVCAHWAMVNWAWNSEFHPDALFWLEKSCAEDDALSCQRRQRIESMRSHSLSHWEFLNKGIEVGAGEEWPRVSEVASSLSMSEWLDVALQGALKGEDSAADLVCGSSIELPEALVCVSKGNKRLNDALGRVVSYVEHGRKILSLTEHKQNPLLRFWQGTDLRRDDFNQAVEILRRQGSLLPEEQRLWDWLGARTWKYLLTFNCHSVFTGVPSHEFLHGLYFSEPSYRLVVQGTVDEFEKSLVAVIGFVEKVFDTSESFILNNEVQASLLQHESMFTDRKSISVREELIRRFRNESGVIDIEKFRQGY